MGIFHCQIEVTPAETVTGCFTHCPTQNVVNVVKKNVEQLFYLVSEIKVTQDFYLVSLKIQ